MIYFSPAVLGRDDRVDRGEHDQDRAEQEHEVAERRHLRKGVTRWESIIA
jgi:hypothetical protein